MSNCKESVKPLPVVCVVYDVKGKIYTSPMTFNNEECAIRWFENLAEKDSTIIDYNLYLIGHFSETLGQIFPLNENSLYLLKSGNELKAKIDTIERLKQMVEYWKAEAIADNVKEDEVNE